MSPLHPEEVSEQRLSFQALDHNMINSPRRSLTRQETVVVTLPVNGNTSFSSLKVEQTAERRGSDPGKKINKVLERHPLKARTVEEKDASVCNGECRKMVINTATDLSLTALFHPITTRKKKRKQKSFLINHSESWNNVR